MIHNLFDEIRDRGWLVSNLFQRDDGFWQANLRTTTHHTEFGRGPTPEIALECAIDAIELATENDPHEVAHTMDSLPTYNIIEVLKSLRPKRTPLITRRL